MHSDADETHENDNQANRPEDPAAEPEALTGSLGHDADAFDAPDKGEEDEEEAVGAAPAFIVLDIEDDGGEGESNGEAAEDGDAPALVVLDLENGEVEDDDEEEDEDDEGEGEDDETGEESAADDAEAAEELALPFDSVVEAILFASREPLKPAQIARAVARGVRRGAVRAAMDRLNLHYLETGRAFEIAEISGRFQLMSRPEYVQHLRRLYPKRQAGDKEKAARLTPAALDTLSIIAYKQPVTRGEVERIRGVGCGAVLRALIERGTVKVAGKRADLVGQPLTYGTTDAFLVEFGLGSLDELPLRNEFLSTFASFGAAAEPDTRPEPETEPAPAPDAGEKPDPEGGEDVPPEAEE